MTTDILGLSELAENQSAKYLTHNEALRQLEAMLIRVKSRTKGLSQITPAAGDVYIINDEYGERTPWAAGTAYTAGDIRVPTTHNGYRYKCTVAGTSGASEPTWPTTIGNTVVDGGVTWKCEVGIWPTSTSYAPDYLAHYYSGAWHYHAPVEGMMLWCVDESADIAYSSSAWGAAPVASHNHDGVYEPASGDFTAKVSQATESLAGKAELATAAEAAAGSDTARVVVPARLAEVMALNKNPLVFSQGIHMTYAASGSTGIQITDNADLDFGTGDFTLVWRGSLPDWASTTSWLIDKVSGGVGYSLLLTSGGILRVYASPADSTYYESTVSVNLDSGSAHTICVSVERETETADGSVTFYVDGIQLGDSLAISAGTPLATDNSYDFYVSGRSSSRTEGICYSAHAFNRALSAADVLDLYRNGIDYADKWGSQTAIYQSDFSAGVDGWTAYNGTVTGNIDGISGYDDVLKFTVNTTSAGHNAQKASVLTVGEKYRITFEYFIPSGQSNVNGLDFYDGSSLSTFSALDAWAKGTIEFTAVGVTAYFRALDDGQVSFQDAAGDDVFYLKNIEIKRIGATLALEPEGINEDKWYDSSDNSLDAAYPSSGSSLVRKSEQDLTIEGAPQFAGLGIGRAHSGSAKLEIKSGNNAYGLLVYASDDSELAGIYEHSSGYSQIIGKDAAGATKILLSTGGDSYLNGGKVGIGTSGPAIKLHVLNNNAALAAGDNGTVLLEENQTGVPAAIIMQSVADNGGAGNQGAIYFDAGADGGSANNRIAFNADHQTDNNYDMVITGGGKVGIGTDAPGSSLEVYNAISSTGHDHIRLSNSAIDHGMTDLVPTNVFGTLARWGSTEGGTKLSGFSEGGEALLLEGIAGIAPVSYPAVEIRGYLKSGTSRTVLGSSDPLFGISNTSNRLMTVLGDGGVLLPSLKSGTSQANAGAAANELWIDTADNSIKIGV